MDKETETDLILAKGEIEFLLPAMGAGDYRVTQVLEQALKAINKALGESQTP